MVNKTLLAGVILEDKAGRIALQLRDNNPEIINPGLWSVFGGHIEPHEEPALAAQREMLEELTISISIEKLKLLGKFELKNKIFYVFHYKVDTEMDKVDLKEGRAWRWCEPKEIISGCIEGTPIVDYHIEFLKNYWNGKIE